MVVSSQQDLKGSVLSILARHEGRENPITAEQLAVMFGHNDTRKVRLAIRELRRDGHVICASTKKPCGYFMAKDKAEAQDFLGRLYNRAMEDLGTYHDVKAGAGFYFDGTRQGGLL